MRQRMSSFNERMVAWRRARVGGSPREREGVLGPFYSTSAKKVEDSVQWPVVMLG